jgi:hypothetical protein
MFAAPALPKHRTQRIASDAGAWLSTPLPEVAAWSLLAVLGALCANQLHAAGMIGADIQRNGFNVYALFTITLVAAVSHRLRSRIGAGWRGLHLVVFCAIIGDQASALISPYFTASAIAQLAGFAVCALVAGALLISRLARLRLYRATRRVRFVHLVSYCL